MFFQYQGEKYQFYVLSRPEATGLILEEPHIVISVTDPGVGDVKLHPDSNVVDVLRLKFYDIDRLIDGIQQMTHEQATQIINFVLKHKTNVKTIVCHCEAGFSRSPGIASILCLWLEGTDSPFYKQHQPNSWVRRLLLRDLYKRGIV